VRLAQLLFSQGFGTRRDCDGLVLSGLVQIDGQVRDKPDDEVEPGGLRYVVRGQEWTYRQRALLVLNKPAGYECSQKPKHHPGVYSLLPAPLRQRGVQAIGRLDEDTTGVLLFTDDGTLIHRLTSPKRHAAKVYEVACKHAVEAAQVEQLLRGVLLHDDNETVRATACEAIDAQTLRLTLVEGKYHQVKRMVAAVGNRVEALHRSDFAGVRVDALAAGAWRWLSTAEEAALLEKTARR
jgi:16S rRNA pseudouridine516 synthase